MTTKYIRNWLIVGAVVLAAFYYIPRINFSCIEGDCYSGEGVYTYNNTYYHGSFQKGYRHGYGMEKYPGGCTYYGFFEGGHKQHYGSYVCEKENYSFTTFWNNGGYHSTVFYTCGDKTYYGKWVKTIICISGDCENGVGKAIFPFKKTIRSGLFKDIALYGYGEEIDACTGKILYKGKFIHSHKEKDYDAEAHKPVKGLDY
ncbi:hypothetical protein [Leptospira alexanderi]|uniref:hypothetical protein n=1 Tax=Leptospira alexanderi TaxID=100053 RepID=UPI000990EF33|nr:hypothetical protein [Leptospira alexanderi]